MEKKKKDKLNFGDYFLLYYIKIEKEPSLEQICSKHNLFKSQVNYKIKKLINKQLIKQIYKKKIYREVYYNLTREGERAVV